MDAANGSLGFGAHETCTGGAHVALAIHSDSGFILPTTDTEKPLEWQQEGAGVQNNWEGSRITQ